MKFADIYDLINRLAPFDTQEDFDNSGLLIGHPDETVRGIHVCLDVSQRVLDEAEEHGANLIVSHHPLFFHPRKALTETDVEGRLICRMVRARMGLIAAHTNWDRAAGGINDTLAALCGLTEITGEGFWRVGKLGTPCRADQLIERLSSALSTVIRPMGQVPGDRIIRMLGVSGGAGSEFWEDCGARGADAFLTGEMKHHHALAASDSGMLVLEAGHFATEEPGIFVLGDALQSVLNAVQCPLRITRSVCGAYALPRM